MFDLAPQNQETLTWNVHLPLEGKLWSIGLIVRPSGCGKSTISRQLWPEESTLVSRLTWESSASVLDAFPPSLPIKEVVSLLSAVGFSSPPAWLRPFHVLSTGQQFRVTLARLLAESPHLVFFDEYSSVVDRTVAQIGSAAVQKLIRQRKQQLIVVTCHEDVEPWLNPDWVYRPAEGLFLWRALQRRPEITLTVIRCQTSAWPLFRL
jgi:ABC-type lipoprotein export system ATPase subunit